MTASATTSPTPAAPAAAPVGSLDPKLIVPLVNSIRSLFNTMIKVPVTIQRPHVKVSPLTTYDVSGIIGLSGELIGSIVLSFQKDTAVKLVSAFAGMTLEATSPDFPDAVGELANMVAGGAKKAFGVMANITVPSVIIGSGHTIARLSDVPCLVVPCQTPVGDFAVEINIKQVTGSEQPKKHTATGATP
jgi:chemotaxis protein CheX